MQTIAPLMISETYFKPASLFLLDFFHFLLLVFLNTSILLSSYGIFDDKFMSDLKLALRFTKQIFVLMRFFFLRLSLLTEFYYFNYLRLKQTVEDISDSRHLMCISQL